VFSNWWGGGKLISAGGLVFSWTKRSTGGGERLLRAKGVVMVEKWASWILGNGIYWRKLIGRL